MRWRTQDGTPDLDHQLDPLRFGQLTPMLESKFQKSLDIGKLKDLANGGEQSAKDQGDAQRDIRSGFDQPGSDGGLHGGGNPAESFGNSTLLVSLLLLLSGLQSPIDCVLGLSLSLLIEQIIVDLFRIIGKLGLETTR